MQTRKVTLVIHGHRTECAGVVDAVRTAATQAPGTWYSIEDAVTGSVIFSGAVNRLDELDDELLLAAA